MFKLDMHPSWDSFFTKDIINELTEIYDTIGPHYPEDEAVLRFSRTDKDVLKCVIVGMDPYPSFNKRDNIPQATGRSFEVSELYGKTWDYPIKQTSLRNILRALYYNKNEEVRTIYDIRKEISAGRFIISDPIEWFNKTEEQGVLWLNSTLTVHPGRAGSHKKQWAAFRKALFKYIAGSDAVFMLWGDSAAREVGPFIPQDKQLRCSHPRVEKFVKTNTFALFDAVNWYV